MPLKSLISILVFLFVSVGVASAQNEIVWGADKLVQSWANMTVSKFGANLDVDATEESIWDMNDLPTAGTGPARCFTNMAAAANLYVSSDDNADATDEITIEVLDANYVFSTIVMDLGAISGTGTAFTQIGAATLLRVNRAYASDVAFTGNIYIHKDSDADDSTDGIPDTPATDIVAGITAGEDQTLQACYTVPAGYHAFITNSCVVNTSEAAAGTAVTFRQRKTEFGASSSRTQLLITLGDETSECVSINPPVRLEAKTDFEYTGGGVGVLNQGTAATFGMYLYRD
jgi:hypothetical protein